MIQIDLCRVTSNGKFIDLILNCSAGYYFTQLQISQFGGEVYSLSSVFYKDGNPVKNKAEWRLRIPTAQFTGDYSMYGVTVTVQTDNQELEQRDGCKKTTKSAACSDISSVYNYILNALLELCCERCNVEVPIEILRTFTMIYAHLQAMKLGDYDNAFVFFKALYNKFSNCPGGCDKANYSATSIKLSGCGCKK